MYSRRRNSSCQACLTEIADGWLEYIVRDVLAVTHEAVFAAVMRKVDAIEHFRSHEGDHVPWLQEWHSAGSLPEIFSKSGRTTW